MARTPNIDALAERGVRYPNACSTAGVCAPSRSAVITGCYQTRLGNHHMKPSFHLPLLDDADDPRPETWGYPDPYIVVPPHYVRAFPEYLRSADYYCTNNGKTHYQFQPDGWKTPAMIWDHNDHGTGDRNVDWRDRSDDDQPFFSVSNLDRTHEGAMRRDDEAGVQGCRETDPGAVDVPPYLPDTPPVRDEIARHYGPHAPAVASSD